MGGETREVSKLPLLVAVLSPEPVVAEGLRAVLASAGDHVRCVDLYHDGPEPDVVLYDAAGLMRGDRTDLEIVLTKMASTVLVVSRDLRPGLAAEALAAGADGHIPLSAEPEEILKALESAATGWEVGDAGTSPVVGSRESATGRALVGDDRGLSHRETQILSLVGQGLSNAEIGQELYLSPNTVKTYIRAAYRKIGATRRTEAAAWALTHGLAETST